MDDTVKIIENELNKRNDLQNEIEDLERKISLVRNKIKDSSMIDQISLVQDEVIRFVDRIDLLNDFIALVSKLFDYEDEYCLIPIDAYKSYSFQGRSIEMVELELTYLTTKVVYFMNLLKRICSIGHNYIHVKNDMVFDFDGLEPTFEEKQICICGVCGGVVHLDLDEKTNYDSSLLERLEKLRIARNLTVYKSKFNVVTKLQR